MGIAFRDRRLPVQFGIVLLPDFMLTAFTPELYRRPERVFVVGRRMDWGNRWRLAGCGIHRYCKGWNDSPDRRILLL